MVLKIKLRTTGGRITPFVSQVQTAGKAQKAFAANIGNPVGSCVKGAVHQGMGIGEIHEAVRNCAKAKKGTKYSTGAYATRRAGGATP